eukprot:13831855-Heterocapsa_arctica.AAC.1
MEVDFGIVVVVVELVLDHHAHDVHDAVQQGVEAAVDVVELRLHDAVAHVGRRHRVGRYPDHHVHRVVYEDLRCRVAGEHVPEVAGEVGDCCWGWVLFGIRLITQHGA